jgi:septum site-determining protein MinC
MKAKQKKIRVFDIVVNAEAKFFEFMDKNLVLVKDYLLLVEGEVTPKIEEFLKENGLCYVLSNSCNIKKIDSAEAPKTVSTPTPAPEPAQPQVIIQEQIVYHDSPSNKTKVINKPIRSGEVIEYDGDIVIFSRVNSGAKVISEGNVSVFETIDGVVEANGDFCLINTIGKGYVVFNGDILEKDDFSDGKTKKVIKTDDGYKIEDL